MGDEKKSFVLYTDAEIFLEHLTDEQAGILFKNIFKHIGNKEPIEMDNVTEMLYKYISNQLDRDAEKYKEVCEKRKISGKKGGEANGSKWKQKEANGSNCFSKEAKGSKCFSEEANGSKRKQIEAKGSKRKQKEADNDIDIDIDTDNESESGNDSVCIYIDTQGNTHTYPNPPSISDVRQFIEDIGSRVNADKFFHYYSSIGWNRYGQPIGNWMELVKYWESCDKQKIKEENEMRENALDEAVSRLLYGDVEEEEDE